MILYKVSLKQDIFMKKDLFKIKIIITTGKNAIENRYKNDRVILGFGK